MCVKSVPKISYRTGKELHIFFQNMFFVLHVFLLDCILPQSWFDLSMSSSRLTQSIQLNCMNIYGGTNCIGMKFILIRFQHEWVWSFGCQGRREGSVEGWGRVKRIRLVQLFSYWELGDVWCCEFRRCSRIVLPGREVVNVAVTLFESYLIRHVTRDPKAIL